ncbi:tRNA 2-thiouridine(34) synthase MnmA [bacterium]|jgi:tRNA-uridine 2-sulfurtransferase|nr:tRNA 2-thiouridine(34) synthase MnmA [bacterium]MBT4334940.1 tRNA 2-thiouridine(34) synthase MnmA [bacterium]MBT4495363.1 tRNA 2-thiouridine(34) synthase MnmA [bacterium]MBT4764155.1 tRNA 2-thiouridine(34) synthase MnmA [bacterium]MBT5401527.1 tRNA 2-thiouridine(34) synthase MnmA [bacterium]
MNKKVIVALSGGVDSSVACYLLKEQGYDVEAVFMKNWTPQSEAEGLLMCPLKADEKDARVVASQLGLKFSTVNFEKEYRENVVEYLFKEYKEGRTPNPDILCNSQIKFKAFLNYALAKGADYVATGHYVRNIDNQLAKGVDGNKDQSYFLFQITKDQLKKCIFPIGEYEKSKIRELAKKHGLITHSKKDSQGICFVGEVEMKEFLKQRLKPKKGDIITTEGKKIGEHEGVWYYTIGQRRGIGVGGGMPYYVVDRDMKKNILIVARGDKDDALFKHELIANEIYWISGVEPSFPLKCFSKIRYRQPDEECEVNKKDDTLVVKFKNKQRAITPGQFIVLYNKDICLGGAKIL